MNDVDLDAIVGRVFRSWYTIISFGVASTEADWEKWFNSGTTDTEGKACSDHSPRKEENFLLEVISVVKRLEAPVILRRHSNA
jgi:hypothetical protein